MSTDTGIDDDDDSPTGFSERFIGAQNLSLFAPLFRTCFDKPLNPLQFSRPSRPSPSLLDPSPARSTTSEGPTGHATTTVCTRLFLFVQFTPFPLQVREVHMESDDDANEPCTPSPRRAHCMVAMNGRLVVFGGSQRASGPTQQAQAISDLWEFNPDENRWAQILARGPNQPGMRHYHSGIAWRDQLVVWGGSSLDDGQVPVDAAVWIFSQDTHTWTRVDTVPAAAIEPGGDTRQRFLRRLSNSALRPSVTPRFCSKRP